MADRPDTTAQAQLGRPVVRPRFLAWLDILGDPVRATTWPHSLAISGTGDPDLDGFTYAALDPTLVSISEVKAQDGGSEQVTASLSGLIGPDNDLLNLLGDPANWRGREARLWVGVCDEDGVPQGAIWAYYTGKMVDLRVRGAAANQTVTVAIETYLADIAPPSNRTYLDQSRFDPDDASAAASITIANGTSAAGAAGGGGSGISGGGRRVGDTIADLF